VLPLMSQDTHDINLPPTMINTTAWATHLMHTVCLSSLHPSPACTGRAPPVCHSTPALQAVKASHPLLINLANEFQHQATAAAQSELFPGPDVAHVGLIRPEGAYWARP
jgi:hypothetical protein